MAIGAVVVLFFEDGEITLRGGGGGGTNGDRHDQQRLVSLHHVDALSGSGNFDADGSWVGGP